MSGLLDGKGSLIRKFLHYDRCAVGGQRAALLAYANNGSCEAGWVSVFCKCWVCWKSVRVVRKQDHVQG